MTSPDDTLPPFACPRCAAMVHERFWGPCRACRAELVASHGTAPAEGAGDPEGTRFEPAMHVVPNHVATKD